MLTELKVSHFAIIDKIHIHFNEGLNILSGETGAGKSILIKSLGLLMGAKSSSQDIRSNKNSATIEGAFEIIDRPDIIEKLEYMGIENDESKLIVRRVIQKNGKSKVYLNGHLSTVSDLRKIVFPLVTLGNPTEAPLVEITGQHENKDLMSLSYQMDTLDQFCGNTKLRDEIKSIYEQIIDLKNKKQELEERSKQREQQIDFLEFQIQEIESLQITEKEDEELIEKIKDLKNQENWQEWIHESIDYLHESDRSALALIKKILRKAPDHSSVFDIKQSLEEASTLLEDAAFQLQSKLDSNDRTDESLEDLEDRLSRIRKLQKRFGSTVSEILISLKEMKNEHRELSNLSDTLEKIDSEIEVKNSEYKKVADKLHKKREAGAGLLAKEVNKELLDLNMKGLEFLVSVEIQEENMSTGFDRVSFKTQTGKKDKAFELSKAASGGELSRILLSLKQVIGANQFPRTFLFDEVDTGVSGPTAEKVGAKLKNLAKFQQVICVTHLPQVASFGDYHFYIEKQPTKGSVEMSVILLEKQQRIEEIARLISGEKITKTSLAHAKELLNHLN